MVTNGDQRQLSVSRVCPHAGLQADDADLGAEVLFTLNILLLTEAQEIEYSHFNQQLQLIQVRMLHSNP